MKNREHIILFEWYIEKYGTPLATEIDAVIERETEKAIMVTSGRYRNLWIPKRAVRSRIPQGAGATPLHPGEAGSAIDTAVLRVRVDDSRTGTPVLRVIVREDLIDYTAYHQEDASVNHWSTNAPDHTAAREAAWSLLNQIKERNRHYHTVVEMDTKAPIKGGADDDELFEAYIPQPAPTLVDLSRLVAKKNGQMTKVLQWITNHYGQWSTFNDEQKHSVMAVLESFPTATVKVRSGAITLDQDGFVRVRCKPEDNDTVKAVGEAYWDGKMGAWRFRPSVGLAMSLMELFPVECFSEAMIRMANPASVARAAKDTAEGDVPDHLTSGPPSWLHQKKAYNMAFPLPAAGIFMQMSTGKTKVVVDLFCNRGHRLGLVVCPKKALEDHVWRDEFALHSTKEVVVIELVGKLVERVRQIRSAPTDRPVVFVGEYYSIWMSPLGEALLAANLDLVVWDEGHRLSSPGSQISTFASRIERKVPYRIMTTGTKIRQRPLNVYGMYRALDRGIFGNSFDRFKEKYVVYGGYDGMEVLGYKNEEEFARRLFSIAYEVKTDDVMELPIFTKKKHLFDLSPAAMRAYKGMDRNKVAHFGGVTSRANSVLTRDLRKLQICSGYLPMDDGTVFQVDAGKTEELKNLFDDLDDDEPVVIFANWHPEMDAIHKTARRAGRSSGELSGRGNDIVDWRDGKFNVLVVQYEAGSEALSMVRAAHLVYFSLSRSMYLMTQSAFRIRRAGQGRTGIFHYLIARGTIEEDVYEDILRLEEEANAVKDYTV